MKIIFESVLSGMLLVCEMSFIISTFDNIYIIGDEGVSLSLLLYQSLISIVTQVEN